MPTEAEFARTRPALAGRALLEAGLSRITPAERAAFEEAVRRCYASAPIEADEPALEAGSGETD